MSTGGYRPAFSEGAAEFLFELPPRRRRKAVSLVRQLAANPHVRSDYVLTDDSGRPVDHILIEDFVIAYWLDHGAREIRIVDIDDAS